MTMTTYANEVATELSNLTGCPVEVKKVNKNNDVQLTGLIIGNDSNVHPTLYVDNSWITNVSVQDAARNLFNKYNAAPSFNIDTEELASEEYIKENVFFNIINKEYNTELLKTLPHKDFLDLAIIYKVKCGEDNSNDVASYKLTNGIFDTLNMTLDELDEVAKVNTLKMFPAKIMNMESLLMGLMIGIATDDTNEIFEIPDNMQTPMIVATNTRTLNGAGVILYENLLQRVADKTESDLYIIPSSVHEVLLVSANNIEYSDLTLMIREVNQTQVNEEEWLSDHPYFYNRETGKITIE